MRFSSVLKSITFRYIAISVATLSLAVFILISSIYAVFSYGYFRDIRDSILEELEAVQLIYNGQQLEGVKQYIADQTENSVLLPFAYLLEDAAGNKLAGNLVEAPQDRTSDLSLPDTVKVPFTVALPKKFPVAYTPVAPSVSVVASTKVGNSSVLWPPSFSPTQIGGRGGGRGLPGVGRGGGRGFGRQTGTT